MNELEKDYPGLLSTNPEAPCLSLYQPTYRHHPDNQQDRIRFKNHIKSLEESLLKRYPTREVRSLLEPFNEVAENRDFWNYTLDGLAILRSPGLFRIYRLQRPVPDLAVVAESFHTKPLLRILQSADRYQVLSLSRKETRLFEGTRDVLDEVDLAPGVPRTITEALGDKLTEPHQTVASYGMGASGTAMRHGHGGKRDEVDIDTERFFRAVDRAITEHHSKPSGLPLLLAALPEHHSVFHQVSHNPFLMDDGIHVSPDALSLDALRGRAWKALEPHYLARLDRLIDFFGLAKARGLGNDDLAQVAEAAVTGRVEVLLVDADRRIPGMLEPFTGRIAFGDLAHPDLDDLIDDLGEAVMKMGGEVLVVPAERMPTRTGVAAIYRF